MKWNGAVESVLENNWKRSNLEMSINIDESMRYDIREKHSISIYIKRIDITTQKISTWNSVLKFVNSNWAYLFQMKNHFFHLTV